MQLTWRSVNLVKLMQPKEVGAIKTFCSLFSSLISRIAVLQFDLMCHQVSNDS